MENIEHYSEKNNLGNRA